MRLEDRFEGYGWGKALPSHMRDFSVTFLAQGGSPAAGKTISPASDAHLFCYLEINLFRIIKQFGILLHQYHAI